MSGGEAEPLVRCSSPEEAISALVSRTRAVGVEEVELGAAAGRVLAQAVTADRPSPACNVSAMDGYAVRTADVRPGALAVVGEVRIGVKPPDIPRSGVLRIVTGAPIPRGSDAVVKREDVDELGADSIRVRPGTEVEAGENIRRRGENALPGSEVVSAGQLVTAPVAAALASFGCVRPRVYRRVRVGVLSTGDEVLDASAKPTEWQLRDGNSPAICAMLSRRAWIDIAAVRRAGDDPAAIGKAAEDLLSRCDALVLSGGVSMGDRDYVPRVLRALGATLVFHRVPQRPGKPILGAVTTDGRPVFGLPGNPLSVMVTCRRIVVPVLERVAGLATSSIAIVVRMAAAPSKTVDLWWHRPVTLIGPGLAELAGTASSGDVAGAARSEGFVEIPPGASGAGPWAYYEW
jgi:molybdopterin molybdotransferase